ncbi:hypothetical protein SUNI508_11108 [Seiridium unicorne]|uniref:Uncharacterized protein n=1 Tax=Seiridium unicorne TaxID=138068 RepID=A0ABR2UIT0_9PEZI
MANGSHSVLFTKYLDFERNGIQNSEAKLLTVIGASVICLLSINSIDDNKTANAKAFLAERRPEACDIISSVWKCDLTRGEAENGEPAVLAWSECLQTVFLDVSHNTNTLRDHFDHSIIKSQKNSQNN